MRSSGTVTFRVRRRERRRSHDETGWTLQTPIPEAISAALLAALKGANTRVSAAALWC
jgi:hypothetical protein